MDGRNCHDLPWSEPLRYRDLECEATPAGPAGAHVFTHYVTWGLKRLLAETYYYKDFLVWDVQHRSWRLPFAFLPATSISPPVFFSLTWRKTEQGWRTSATPPYANLIRDARNRRSDCECLHIQIHASDLAMLPYHTRLIWLIPLPEEWSWLPTWHPGVHPDSYKDADIWKKPQYVGAQSLSSTEPAASSTATPSTSVQCLSSGRPAPSVAPMLSSVAEDQIEPEDTHPTPAMQQRSDVPSQQAYPYVTHAVESESEDDKVIAQSSFGKTLVQHVCRSMSDKEAHEAVMNKTWFRKVSELDAPRLQQRIGSSRLLSMTVPAWASNKQQGEPALWSGKKDIGTGPESSSFSSTPNPKGPNGDGTNGDTKMRNF